MKLFYFVLSIYILAIISPGPDFIIVAKNSLLNSRRIAIYNAIGISAGVALHLTYCIIGLSFISINFIKVINIIKFIGGSYLIYYGLTNFFDKNNKIENGNFFYQVQVANSSAFFTGLFCNLFNPKACIFFISLFTSLISQEINTKLQIVYALSMVIVTFLWFLTVSFIFSIPKIQKRLSRFQEIIIKVLSVILIIFGVYLLKISI